VSTHQVHSPQIEREMCSFGIGRWLWIGCRSRTACASKPLPQAVSGWIHRIEYQNTAAICTPDNGRMLLWGSLHRLVGRSALRRHVDTGKPTGS